LDETVILLETQVTQIVNADYTDEERFSFNREIKRMDNYPMRLLRL